MTKTLPELNAAVHTVLDDLLLDCLEEFTQLNLPAAKERWEELAVALSAHRTLEDALSLPVYRRLDEFPQGGAPENFDKEHQMFDRLLDKGRAILVAVANQPNRRHMVKEFDGLSQIRRVLEHHTLREERHLYPALERLMEPGERAQLVETLLDQGKPPQ